MFVKNALITERLLYLEESLVGVCVHSQKGEKSLSERFDSINDCVLFSFGLLYSYQHLLYFFNAFIVNSEAFLLEAKRLLCELT